METNIWKLAKGRGAATQIKGAEIMETVMSFVMLAMLGIAILFVVLYALIAFLLDSWEIK